MMNLEDCISKKFFQKLAGVSISVLPLILAGCQTSSDMWGSAWADPQGYNPQRPAFVYDDIRGNLNQSQRSQIESNAREIIYKAFRHTMTNLYSDRMRGPYPWPKDRPYIEWEGNILNVQARTTSDFYPGNSKYSMEIDFSEVTIQSVARPSLFGRMQWTVIIDTGNSKYVMSNYDRRYLGSKVELFAKTENDAKTLIDAMQVLGARVSWD